MESFSIWVHRIEEALRYYVSMSKAFDPVCTKSIVPASALEQYTAKQIPLEFAHIKCWIQALFGEECWEKLSKVDQEISRIEVWNNETLRLTELASLKKRDFIHYLYLIYKRVETKILIFRTLWVGKMGSLSIQDLENKYRKIKKYNDGLTLSKNLTLIEALRANDSIDCLLKQIRKSCDELDEHRISFVFESLKEMLKDIDAIPTYTDHLHCDNYSCINLDDKTEEAQTLRKAKQILLELALKKLGNIPRMFKYYEILRMKDQQINELPDNYLDQEIDEIDIFEIIESLFPKQVLSFHTQDAWGECDLNFNIVLEPEIIRGVSENTKVVQTMVVVLHEIGYKVKHENLANYNFGYKTPPRIKALSGHIDKQFTTGTTIEEVGFGARIRLESLTDEIAEQIVDVDNLDEQKWSQIVKDLTKTVEGSIISSSSNKCSKVRRIRTKGCGTNPFLLDLED